MTASQDLFLSILSMDSYNRGYAPGIEGLSSVNGTAIGNATISRTKGDAVAQAAGFYAVEYTWDSTTVISYRGTTFTGLPSGADVFNGWSLIDRETRCVSVYG
jgi:hypothetical protein